LKTTGTPTFKGVYDQLESLIGPETPPIVADAAEKVVVPKLGMS
jgi:hypothetical protein